MKIKHKKLNINDCPYEGDSSNCEDCVYYPDYEYNKRTDECRIKEKNEHNK